MPFKTQKHYYHYFFQKNKGNKLVAASRSPYNLTRLNPTLFSKNSREKLGKCLGWPTRGHQEPAVPG